MKIFSTEQLREWDKATMNAQNITPVGLVQKAAEAFCRELRAHYMPKRFVVCAGSGNNGADGLAVASILEKQGWKLEAIYLLLPTGGSCSQENIAYQAPLKSRITPVAHFSNIPSFAPDVLIIDALFGTGLHDRLSGVASGFVDAINASGAEVVSLDLPSGMGAMQTFEGSKVVKSQLVLTFALPKLSFFLKESAPYIGAWVVVDLGLDQHFLKTQESVFHTLSEYLAGLLLRSKENQNIDALWESKLDRGHAGLICGSFGMMGAAVLAARGAMRSGLGKLTVQAPRCGYEIMQMAVPEAMTRTPSQESQWIDSILLKLEHMDAVGFGPGIGKHKGTTTALKLLIHKLALDPKPLVLDADGILHIQKLTKRQRDKLFELPLILTPHEGEFEALLGQKPRTSLDRLVMQRQFSIDHGCIVAHKGRYSSVSLPDGRLYFNMTGNPGMATAGSGDVLTGIIVGILAQGYTMEQATLLGVCLHGMAGDVAASNLGMRSMNAGDIIHALPKATTKLMPPGMHPMSSSML